jgi:hypothetical protein
MERWTLDQRADIPCASSVHESDGPRATLNMIEARSPLSLERNPDHPVISSHINNELTKFFLVHYQTTLSVSRLHSIDDTIIIGYKAVSEMTIGK